MATCDRFPLALSAGVFLNASDTTPDVLVWRVDRSRGLLSLDKHRRLRGHGGQVSRALVAVCPWRGARGRGARNAAVGETPGKRGVLQGSAFGGRFTPSGGLHGLWRWMMGWGGGSRRIRRRRRFVPRAIRSRDRAAFLPSRPSLTAHAVSGKADTPRRVVSRGQRKAWGRRLGPSTGR